MHRQSDQALTTIHYVRRLVIASIATLVAACSMMPLKPAKPTAPDLTGAWLLTTESKMGAEESTMTIRQTGSAFAGTLTSRMGSVHFTGNVEGSAVAFGFLFSAPGADLRIDYSGVVEGDAMQGRTVFGAFAEGTFSAKRKAPALICAAPCSGSEDAQSAPRVPHYL